MTKWVSFITPLHFIQEYILFPLSMTDDEHILMKLNHISIILFCFFGITVSILYAILGWFRRDVKTQKVANCSPTQRSIAVI